MIRIVSGKGKHSKNAERKLVSRMCFMGFVGTQDFPDHDGPEMCSGAEEEWAGLPS